MKVTLSKALKEKSRIAGKVRKNMELIAKENSKPKGSPRSVDVEALLTEARELMERLIRVKAAIAGGNAGAVATLVELEEVKSMITRLRAIDTGDLSQYVYGTGEVKYTVVISRDDVEKAVDELQLRADRLQDELDDYNVKTMVEI